MKIVCNKCGYGEEYRADLIHTRCPVCDDGTLHAVEDDEEDVED
jgi:predicted nucleic-acid-binding Zn-ribbon protein